MPPQPITRSGSGARTASETTVNGRGHSRAAIHFHGAGGRNTRKSVVNPAASASPNAWARSPARSSLRIHGLVTCDMAGGDVAGGDKARGDMAGGFASEEPERQ